MAVLGATNLTLADWTKRVDPDGKPAVIAELLAQDNEHLEDIVLKEGNLPLGESVTVRTGLPTVYYRAIGQGVADSKSTTAQVTEGCAMLEARSNVDCKLARLQGNLSAFRASEATAFIEAMGQTQGTGMFYGNPVTDPKQYLGFAGRYSLLSATNGTNILDAGGTSGSMTSIWLVGWGDQSVYCHFPKGLQGGLEHKDLGEQMIQNSDGTKMQAYCDLYQWDLGLAVKDWRNVVRIANINTTDLLAGTNAQALTAGTHIIKLMARALYKVKKTTGVGRWAFYMNRTVHSGLAVSAMDKSQSVLAIQDGLNQFGTAMRYLTFQGVPIRRCDALLNSEARVV